MPKKILIAEDSPTVLEIMKQQLEIIGYIVITAADGEEALEKIGQDKPDLILLDIVMPKLDGFGVLSQLKADESLKPIPIIMLTAKDDAETVERCLSSGAADYIVKPVTTAVLQEKIRKACLPAGRR